MEEILVYLKILDFGWPAAEGGGGRVYVTCLVRVFIYVSACQKLAPFSLPALFRLKIKSNG